MTVPTPKKPGPDAFHKERSKCIDSFAALEERIIALLTRLDVKTGSETFGQKLDRLGKVIPNPLLSKARHTELIALVPRCRTLGDLRNDIVHSRLQIAEIGDETRACFTNTRQCLSGSQTARLFSLDGLRSVRTETDELTAWFAQF